MLVYTVFILSALFVVGFVGFSSKPSPIYGGMSLIVSGAMGCGIIVCFGGSFLGLMVFLIYLGGMLVVFGYTTAMAMEQYPEVWASNMAVLGSFVIGSAMEFLLVLYVLFDGGLEFGEVGDWAVCDFNGLDFFSEEAMGVSALYSYGGWLVIITGWSLFFGVVVILEITRGN